MHTYPSESYCDGYITPIRVYHPLALLRVTQPAGAIGRTSLVGGVSLSSAGCLHLGVAIPLQAVAFCFCRQYVKDRAGAGRPRRGYSLRWEQAAYHAILWRVPC